MNSVLTGSVWNGQLETKGPVKTKATMSRYREKNVEVLMCHHPLGYTKIVTERLLP